MMVVQLLKQKDEATFFFDALDYSAPIRASIERFDLSGHADREELLDYAQNTEARSIILTHGEKEARDWFREQLAQSMPSTKVIDPEPMVSYSV